MSSGDCRVPQFLEHRTVVAEPGVIPLWLRNDGGVEECDLNHRMAPVEFVRDRNCLLVSHGCSRNDSSLGLVTQPWYACTYTLVHWQAHMRACAASLTHYGHPIWVIQRF